LAVFNFVFCSSAQTPLPLIHPAGSISGGAERGEVQNQGGDDWMLAITIWSSHLAHCACGQCTLLGLDDKYD
jgi:hypothetical protein